MLSLCSPHATSLIDIWSTNTSHKLAKKYTLPSRWDYRTCMLSHQVRDYNQSMFWLLVTIKVIKMVIPSRYSNMYLERDYRSWTQHTWVRAEMCYVFQHVVAILPLMTWYSYCSIRAFVPCFYQSSKYGSRKWFGVHVITCGTDKQPLPPPTPPSGYLE